jgi:hypothetical protein
MINRTLDECTKFKKTFKVFGTRITFLLADELWYNDILIKGGELGTARSYSYFSFSKITHPDLKNSKYSVIIFKLKIWISK